MSNILTILVSVIFYFIAHSFSVIIDLVVRAQNEVLLYLVKFLQVLFPPFEAINLKDSI
jgi:5-bromo-4-chloroindolyl phosphate hydrolysis protein